MKETTFKIEVKTVRDGAMGPVCVFTFTPAELVALITEFFAAIPGRPGPPSPKPK